MIDSLEDAERIESVFVEAQDLVELQELQTGDEYADASFGVQHDSAGAVFEEKAEKRAERPNQQLVVERQHRIESD